MAESFKKLESEVEKKLKRAVSERVAHGFQFCLGWKETSFRPVSVGRVESHGPRLRNSSWFDLASLTKAIATSSQLMFLRQSGQLKSLDEEVGSFFPFLQSRLKNTTLRSLLNHCSGLPPIIDRLPPAKMESKEKKRKLLELIDEEARSSEPKELYSDLGYLVLGFVIEEITGQNLASVFAKTFPVELFELSFESPGKAHFFSRFLDRPHQVATLNEAGEVLEEQVHDLRARWLGCAAGHSGLFGTARGVEEWGREIYLSYFGKALRLSDQIVGEFFSEKTGRFVGGFDTPSPSVHAQGRSQSGNITTEKVVGHLGFTGCSFWMSLDQGWRISLLASRFQEGIDPSHLQKWRPDFHQWLREELSA